MSRRRRGGLRAIAWAVPLFGILAVLASAEALVSHSAGLAAVIILGPLAGFALGRASAGRIVPRTRLELARLRAEVAELETAAGRPLAAIVASYRAIQRRYSGRKD